MAYIAAWSRGDQSDKSADVEKGKNHFPPPKKNFPISSWRKSRRPENVDKALMNSLGGKNKLNYRIYVQYIYLIYVSRTRRWRQKVFFFFFF